MKPRSKDDWIVMLDAIDAMLAFLRRTSREQITEFVATLTPNNKENSPE